jgi:hypothetical protein
MMTPNMLRQFWALIESTQVSTILQFDDSALVQLLIKQFMADRAMDAQSANTLNDYIQAKLPLIRDLASERQVLK